MERSLRVLDGGVVVFDGVAGVEPQSETVWRQADKYNVPRLCFINKLDRIGADFYKDLQSIYARLTKRAHPIQLPIGAEEGFVGIINLLTQKAYLYRDEDGTVVDEVEIPEEMNAKVTEYRAKLVEAIVEQDETAMSQYLEGREIPVDTLQSLLRKATIAGSVIPILCGSALKNKGVQKLLDAVTMYLPSPLDIPPVHGEDPKDASVKLERKADDAEPLAALAFKIASDPFVGRLAFVRVYSGVLQSGSYVLNSSVGRKERISRLVRMHANKREEIKEVFAGDIAAAVGLKDTTTGDTLCDLEKSVLLERIIFPEPVISIAIEPKTKVDQEKDGHGAGTVGGGGSDIPHQNG